MEKDAVTKGHMVEVITPDRYLVDYILVTSLPLHRALQALRLNKKAHRVTHL